MASIDKRGTVVVDGKTMNRYRLRVSNGFDKDGKRVYITRTVTASSDSAANKLLALFISEVERGEAASDTKMTFADFTEKWLRDYAATRLSPKTLQEWKKRLDKRIVPEIGTIRLSSLKASHIDKFIADLAKGERQDGKKGELSPRTLKDYFTQIKTMLGIAVKWGVIGSNPCDKAATPRIRKKAPNALDQEDLPKFLDAIKKESPIHQAMVLLSFGTGVREGELMGLEWRHIDLKKGTMRIEQAAQYIKGQGTKIKPPKTDSSIRTISIPAFAVTALKRWDIEQKQLKMQLGEKWPEETRIFTNKLGSPLKADYCSSWWAKFRKESGLPDNVTFHGLRHSSASLLLAQGMSIADVSKRLGHSTINTTAAIYLHGQKASDAVAANKMDILISGISKAKKQEA
jgi:integrase